MSKIGRTEMSKTVRSKPTELSGREASISMLEESVL